MHSDDIETTKVPKETKASATETNFQCNPSSQEFFPTITMAQLVSAKPASRWKRDELLAYNIEVVTADMSAFFSYPPAPNIPNVLNNIADPGGAIPKTERHFFRYLSTAEKEMSAVDDFVAFILRMLDYDASGGDRGRVVRLWKEISFYMAGQSVGRKVDVCVINDSLDYLLLVERDRVSELFSVMNFSMVQR